MTEQTAAAEPGFARVPKPDHVPPEAVVEFDVHRPEGLSNGNVYEVLNKLHDGPDIRWTPYNGGHWIVTRAEDIRWVQQTFAIFSHEQFFVPRGTVRVKMPPLTSDPPVHARYRAVLNPFFQPAKAKTAAEDARAHTVAVIERLRDQGECEFVNDFARVMPLIAFLSIVDLPFSEREQFLEWGHAFSRSLTQEARDSALEPIVAYIKRVLDDRYANPGADLFSAIARWRDNPLFTDESEVLGMALQIFFGGLDTVANMLGFMTWHLAEHPEHRRRLRQEPEIIPNAVEEYFRRHGLSNTARLILSDVGRKGVVMKKDEMVMVPIGLSSLDERLHPDPFVIDFDRSENFANGFPAHNTFGNGPHRCVGNALARAELRMFLEEWLRLIPDFELDPGFQPQTHMGFVIGMDSLHLRWG